ncbi:MAG: sortase [Acidimicrobiia bacterium]
MTRTVRIIRGVGWAMIWAGLLILAFLAYQLWGTGLVTSAQQEAAVEEVDDYFDDFRAGLDQPQPDESPIRLSDDGAVDESSIVWSGPTFLTPEPEPAAGEAFAVITFPSLADPSEFRSGDIGVDELRTTGPSYVVRAGEDLPNLRRGPGHYLDSPLPGQPGNAAIAGHRTTYGAPFNRLDELAAGDPIIVETAIGTHVYVVRDPRTVHDESRMLDVGDEAGWMAVRANALWVVDPLDGAMLTLTTCHPEFSSRQRLVVVAELVSGPNARYVAEEAA